MKYIVVAVVTLLMIAAFVLIAGCAQTPHEMCVAQVSADHFGLVLPPKSTHTVSEDLAACPPK
jgi:hypothetical protein